MHKSPKSSPRILLGIGGMIVTNFIRRNAWTSDGTFSNLDLLWYAKGVGVMQSRALDDPNSWWFFAAIHGEYIVGAEFPSWGSIPTPPSVPTTPSPSQNLKNLYWNQCQHQSWYFPPWHRGYLLALEAQVRAVVVGLGGPSTWALPYWNYLGPESEYEIPPAFIQQTLPDGTPNALFVKARYGPNNDDNIFIPIPPASWACQTNDLYTGSDSVTPWPGYGGPATGFSHSGGASGNLENNPHNLVHVDVGGFINEQKYGLMSDPGMAALDPIFYLHHSNIDRMWAAWNANGNSNPVDPNWLGGPPAVGEQKFAMPFPDGSSWVYTPADVNSLNQLDYTYDDLFTGVPAVPSSNKFTQRLMKLGSGHLAAAKIASGEDMDNRDNAELVGASKEPLRIKSSGARATVRLDHGIRVKMSASLALASEVNVPDQVYLQLENIRGNIDAFKLNISVNQQIAGTVALFGLRRATLKDGRHGGEGLTFVLDITNIIDNLFLDNALDADSLDVRIVPNQAVPDNAEFTVGRVSVYRRGQQ